MNIYWLGAILFALSSNGISGDLGFRFINGKCQKDGKEGLNPYYVGQCSNLQGVVLQRFDFSKVDLSGSLMANSDFQNSKFSQSNLSFVNFENSNLGGADFTAANLTGGNLKGGRLRKALFFDAKLQDVNFSNADASGVLFDYLEFNSVNFENASLSSASFLETKHLKSNFSKTMLDSISFASSQLIESNFENGSLQGASFENASIESTSFKSSDLRYANFQKTALKNTLFSGAKINRLTAFDFSLEEAERLGMLMIRFFEFSGIKHDLDMNELEGWTPCYQTSYAAPLVTESILKDCKGSKIMIACRKTKSSILTLAANGSRSSVFLVDDSNEGTIDNDVKFYFNTGNGGGNGSLGFANSTSKLQRNTCDTEMSEAQDRLCFHTNYNDGGWRCGSAINLNGSQDYEKLIFYAE